MSDDPFFAPSSGHHRVQLAGRHTPPVALPTERELGSTSVEQTDLDGLQVAATESPIVHPKQRFPKSTPLKPTQSSRNPLAFEPHENKNIGPGLINETGMGPRWHLVRADLMLRDMPGGNPTDEHRASFVAPDFSDVHAESDIYIELVSH